MRKDRGFTLVEILIVLAIVSILGAIAYPGYMRHVAKMRRVEAQLALVETMQRQEQYRALHHTYVAFSSAATDADSRQFRWWLGARPGDSAYELDGRACAGQAIDQCIELRARPGTANVDAGFSDPDCGVLTYDSTGAQGSAGSAGSAGSGTRCWP